MNLFLYMPHGPIHGDYLGLFLMFILIYIVIDYFIITPKKEDKPSEKVTMKGMARLIRYWFRRNE